MSAIVGELDRDAIERAFLRVLQGRHPRAEIRVYWDDRDASVDAKAIVDQPAYYDPKERGRGGGRGR
ncbi:MAG: hypothetical protein ACRDK7_11975 [Solirubrobacteraceae bacterium]